VVIEPTARTLAWVLLLLAAIELLVVVVDSAVLAALGVPLALAAAIGAFRRHHNRAAPLARFWSR
jgi:hypothetical protein